MAKKKKKSKKILLLSAMAFVCVIIFFLALSLLLIQSKRSSEPNPVVVLETTMGEIELSLDRTRAPATVEEFLLFVDEKYYDGTIIYDITPGRFVQGGVYTADFRTKPAHAPIILESNSGLKNKAWTIGLARQSDSAPSSGAFYINLADNPDLDYNPPEKPGFAVFGNVSSGFDTLKAMNSSRTVVRFKSAGWPAENIIITKAYRKR